MLRNFLIFAFIGLMVGCGNGSTTGSNTNSTATNNTATNSTKNSSTPTVLDQKENREDVARTAEIRDKVLAEKLSLRADNVKIITRDGHVTLTGYVDSTDEKSKVEEVAKNIAGEANVESLLEVKAAE